MNGLRYGKWVLAILLGILQVAHGQSQSFQFQKLDVPEAKGSSLRGLCVVSEKVVWTTGSRGTILRTTDGQNFERFALPYRNDVEIRDVHAWDDQHALVMIAGQPAEFWETMDGGQHWTRVFVDPRPTAFYDDFLVDSDTGLGLAFGDVVERAIPLVHRDAEGRWSLVEDLADLSDRKHLHGYAASGTCMVRNAASRWLVGTGGATSDSDQAVVLVSEPDQWRRWHEVTCPMPAGDSAGIFSLAVSGQHVVAVGGDYLKPDQTEGVSAYSEDGGQTWHSSTQGPHGFRSGVSKVPKLGESAFICVGTNGSDYSIDGGIKWTSINQENLNAVAFPPGQPNDPAIGWAVGGNGAIVRIQVIEAAGR